MFNVDVDWLCMIGVQLLQIEIKYVSVLLVYIDINVVLVFGNRIYIICMNMVRYDWKVV